MKVRGKHDLVAQRIQKRKGIALEDRAIAISTRVRYFVAVRMVLPLVEQFPNAIDAALCRWIDKKYLEGSAITHIGDALCGLHHFAPWLRGELKGAWRLFRLWRRIEKPSPSPPLPEAFIEAMIGKCLESEDLELALPLPADR